MAEHRLVLRELRCYSRDLRVLPRVIINPQILQREGQSQVPASSLAGILPCLVLAPFFDLVPLAALLALDLVSA